MYCQNCGKEVTGNFCPNCGAENSKDESEKAEQSVATDTTSVTAETTSATPATSATTVATATKSDYKIKIIATVIVLAIIGGICWGISHFLFGGTEKEEEQKPTFIMNMTAAETTLEDYVSYPSTLEFSYYEEDWNFVTNDNKRIKMESFFECSNAFGVTETHDFVLVITYSDDYESFTINELSIDKEEYV